MKMTCVLIQRQVRKGKIKTPQIIADWVYGREGGRRGRKEKMRRRRKIIKKTCVLIQRQVRKRKNEKTQNHI